MPVTQRREEKYSRVTGVIFLFNLIVGTGALALPGALQTAGWIAGVILLIILALVSLVTVTFIVESLAVSNAVSRKRYEESQIPEETPLVSQESLVSNSSSNVFEITEKYELGQMGVLMSPKWCQVIIYLCLCVYLFGDLAIYALVVGKTCSHVVCSFTPDNMSDMSLPLDTPCWKGSGLTRGSIYRVSVTIFILLLGPFVFFNLQKTKFLQILTAMLRWLAFFIMFIWSIQKLVKYGRKGHPPLADFKEVPTLFGTLVYSFMCQHSVPGLLQPISNKSNLYVLIGIDYSLAAVFYLALSLTAIFAFHKVDDLFTLNFWADNTKPGASIFPKILAYYLALFPVFTLSTSFPIIAITLRNNLRNMIMRDRPPVWYYDRLLFPLVTIIPPTVLALAVTDLHILVGIIGSYAGACVQYLIPCLLIMFARSAAKEFSGRNIYASPFKGKYWVYSVYVWMIVCLILITINYATKLHS